MEVEPAPSPAVAPLSARVLDNYTVDQPPVVLGRGGFGFVIRAHGIHSGQSYAIKGMNSGLPPCVQASQRELKAFLALQLEPHPNIIRCVEADPSSNCLIYELGGINLNKFLNRPALQGQGMLEADARDVFKQMVAGVQHLHTRLVMAHLDLKPDNWVLCGRIEEHATAVPYTTIVKLIDFGLSRMARWPDAAGHPAALVEPGGSLPFAAPEMFAAPAVPHAVRTTPLHGARYAPNASSAYDGFLADVWSLGVCLFVLICGHLPFEENVGTWLRPPPYRHCACWVRVSQEINWHLSQMARESSPTWAPTWQIGKLILRCYGRPCHLPDLVEALLTGMLMPLPYRRLNLQAVEWWPWLRQPSLQPHPAAPPTAHPTPYRSLSGAGAQRPKIRPNAHSGGSRGGASAHRSLGSHPSPSASHVAAKPSRPLGMPPGPLPPSLPAPPAEPPAEPPADAKPSPFIQAGERCSLASAMRQCSLSSAASSGDDSTGPDDADDARDANPTRAAMPRAPASSAASSAASSTAAASLAESPRSDEEDGATARELGASIAWPLLPILPLAQVDAMVGMGR